MQWAVDAIFILFMMGVEATVSLHIQKEDKMMLIYLEQVQRKTRSNRRKKIKCERRVKS